MKTVAIICEYNPFHIGHLYQVSEIRKEFGNDTNIIAIMSGNFTQRGETAIADKGLRARCAVECGINLVLELPFPYSSSSAEIFARSALRIAENLGCVDILSFGSESGDLEELKIAAEYMLDEEFESILGDIISSKDTRSLGYPEAMELALKKVSQEKCPTFSPNNILAIEYIKALKSSKSKIAPHTIKRCGAGYSEEGIVDGEFQSATAIRNALKQKDISALEYVPNITKNILMDAFVEGAFPCDYDKLSTAIISSFRLNSPEDPESISDAQGGLYNRLKEKSLEANNTEELLAYAEAKGYTRARIRRTILSSFVGVTSSDVKEFPMYTQILALDDKGRAILKGMTPPSDFFVITKPSSTDALSDQARRQKALADKADSVFQLTKPIPPSGGFGLRYTPFVKK